MTCPDPVVVVFAAFGIGILVAVVALIIGCWLGMRAAEKETT